MKKLLDARNYRIYDFYPKVWHSICHGGGTGRASLNVKSIKEYEAILGREKQHGR